jgi:thiamine-phosphate pyrophosphorylase
MTRRQALRILDANLNRSREGLRVCEEVARFVLDDAAVTRRLKAARHAVTAALRRLPFPPSELTAARDSTGDVGRGASPLERGRGDALDLFLANAERAKEALRVLEEFSKVVGGDPAAFKRIRFHVYAIEKRTLPKLEALRHHGADRRPAAPRGRATRRPGRGRRRAAAP